MTKNGRQFKRNEELEEEYYANVPCWSCRQNAWHWRSAKVWNIISLVDANSGQLPQLPQSNDKRGNTWNHLRSPPMKESESTD